MNKVYVESSSKLNGVLRFSSLDPQFGNRTLLDGYGTLRNRDRILDFEDYLQSNNYELEFVDEQAHIIYNSYLDNVNYKFEVESPFLVSNRLFIYQSIGLNFVRNQLENKDFNRILIQWDTGAGKTLLSCLTAQDQFSSGKIDKVLVFCKKIKQYDWQKEFERMTTLSVNRIGDLSRDKRHKLYLEDDSDVLVLNYEKVRGPSLTRKKGQRKKEYDYGRTDLLQILDLIKDKRVLVVIDEAQKINSGSSLLGEGFEQLINRSEAEVSVLGLTATPYTTSPLNIRNIFSVIAPGIPGVSDLGIDQFKNEYGLEFDYFGPHYARQLMVKKWDSNKLPLLGKKHENWTHIAMKSDPLIAAQFPESVSKRIIYELSDIDAEIYEFAEDKAREMFEESEAMAAWGYVDTLRMICNTTEGLTKSSSKLAEEIVKVYGKHLKTENSAKYQLIENELENYFDNGDKAVLFTFWTNGTLFPYLEALRNKFPRVPILPLWGVGMKEEEATHNIRQFNDIKGPVVLLTSDVGQEGLNLYAPYLWNIEVPRTYAEYKQRKDRINRADSKSKGISHTWAYRTVASNTIEERVDAKVLRRRREAESIRGVADELADMEDTVEMSAANLLFGTK
jgi:superfamily II DNA or RNA helicase